ncbi:MAG TPA: citrate/2-methylcitrate synthase [Phycisphaerae bacterium]|nr:citrate/2-methylcitrate synthase [Phycisphaerae bacterium]
MAGAKYKAGLEGVVVGPTSVSEVTQTGLRYRGYDIQDLAHNACFDEVAHLLLYEELPTAKQLADFRARIQGAMALPTPVGLAVANMPFDTEPMDVLRSAVSLLAHYDPDCLDNSRDADRRKAERLLGQLAATLGMWAQKTTGVPAVRPDPKASHGGNLLAMLLGRHPSELAARVMDVTLILYAEHEFNASTFTARTIASTMADLHSAVTGAIAALKGPLHGGANEAAMKQFLEIGEPANVDSWFRECMAYNEANPDQKRLIMGFGHRVYKKGDHRAAILRDWSIKLSKQTGITKWLEIADRLQAIMFEEKGLYPNLDYPASHTYYQLGIPIQLYTPIFVCSRVTGWCAHLMEQYENNRIIRPLSEYTGPPPRRLLPIERRQAGGVLVDAGEGKHYVA